jgi:hypothetical protein
MTIRRQYSLPNCTLVLDGLSDRPADNGIADSRPIMSSLFNAECHFAGYEQPLFGGRDFLTSLVTTVSNYAQELLSGIPHSLQPQTAKSLVSIVKGDRDNIHYLEAQQESSSTAATGNVQPARVNLSTIQFFDLLEAIDQFLADRRTLPDIMIPLQPIRKALAQPISTQVVPVGMGIASLVVAGLVGYALPSPQVSAPKSLVAPAPVVAAKTPKPTETPQPASSAAPAPSSTLPSNPNQIVGATPVEATQIGFLERKLQRDLNQNWQDRDRIKQPANFQVSVNQDGQIVSYQALDKTDIAQSKLTPLAKLSTENTDPNQAIASFNVVFNPTGAIEIKPAPPIAQTIGLGRTITEPKLQTALAAKLKTTLQKSLVSPKPLISQSLNYRVAVTKTGEIADYEPTDALAANSQAKTPLPKLAKFNPQAAISQEPLAQYQVIFQPDGKILVTPK